MIKLDAAWLAGLGWSGLTDAQERYVLQQIGEALEQRTGTRMSEGLTDEQMSEFENLMAAGEQDAALRWVQATVPHYRSIVREELRRIEDELRQAAERLNGTRASA